MYDDIRDVVTWKIKFGYWNVAGDNRSQGRSKAQKLVLGFR